MAEDILQDPPSELDRAISSRLAKLRTVPVDVSRVERAIREKTARAPEPARISWLRIAWAIGGILLLIAAILAIILWR